MALRIEKPVANRVNHALGIELGIMKSSKKIIFCQLGISLSLIKIVHYMKVVVERFVLVKLYNFDTADVKFKQIVFAM